ncbi:MAG: hypothetical protein IJE27_03790 [Anaerotignum sp.]|nr:hypothetical protein [Anaerotignum sp.]
MWFLEWEENSEKQEEKRKKGFVLAIFCFVVAVLVMFITEYILYDSIVETNAGVFLASVIGAAIAFFMEQGSLKIRVEKERNRKAEYIIILVLTTMIFALSSIDGQVLAIVQWVCLVPIGLWLAGLLEKEKYDKDMVYIFSLGVISLVMLVTTVFVPKVMGYQNIYAAERIVTAEGYEVAEYLGWMKGAWIYQDVQDKSFYHEDMAEEPYYMIFARKDKKGEAYRVIVDPKGGDIILAASETEEPELTYWSWR